MAVWPIAEKIFPFSLWERARVRGSITNARILCGPLIPSFSLREKENGCTELCLPGACY
jgi:hypothetical protein